MVFRLLIYYQKKYKVLLIDKENNFGLHTSSRNTEIVHAGIYYKPNSLKAKMSIQGKNLLYNFCDKYKVPYKKCGKIFLGYNNDHLKILNLSILEQNQMDLMIFMKLALIKLVT